jgi:hypothetical protein
MSACGSISRLWPFGKKAAGPEVANALVFESEPGAAVSVPQYWKRNSVVIDLQSMSGQGRMLVKPREGIAWPVRVTLRTRPGSVGEIDVRGTQRVILPVPESGSAPVDIELAPGVVRPETALLTITWGPRVVPSDTPQASAPGS